MSVGNLFFLVCSLVSVFGALTTVAARTPIRSAMGLLVTIVGIAGLFLKLGAQFLAAIQLIVYAGAVVVLFVFVVMLLGSDAATPKRVERVAFAPAFAGGLFAGLAGAGVFLLLGGDTTVQFAAVPADHGSVEAVGGLLFGKALVPFELATALLIVAVVGAIAVAGSRHSGGKKKQPVRSPRDFFVGPLGPAPEPVHRAAASTTAAPQHAGASQEVAS